MVRCMRLGSVVRAGGRALSTAATRQQQRALAADSADHNQVIRKNLADVQRERTEQARHSLLISCPSKMNEMKFMKNLLRHGEIANHFFFESSGTHAVVEFVNTESIDSLLSATKIPEEENMFVVPLKSRFIRVKMQEMKSQYIRFSQQSSSSVPQLLKKLSNAKSIVDQAQIILKEHQLKEENIRLRFLVSSLVNDICSSYFPEATVHIYGSTVNSFGKFGCDLDLFLNLDNPKYVTRKDTGLMVTEYWMKRVSSSRVLQQRVLSVLGECIDSFGPGCTEVHKILSARCPLVRFYHQATGLQCDLTADNRIAMKSSELMYIYGNIDSRVRPLVYTLRCWARVHRITSAVSGHWITNFSLTTMILFFLQKRNPPIIPTLNQLKNLADEKDTCIIDGNDCTFVSDLNKLKASENTETIDTLIHEFLEFYGGFDFSKNGIDMRRGVVCNKPETSPLYIQNPFEKSLNISKNVNNSQVERFVSLLQESSWNLQNRAIQSSKVGKENWGLSSILIPDHSSFSPGKKKANEKLVNLLNSLKTDDGSKEAKTEDGRV